MDGSAEKVEWVETMNMRPLGRGDLVAWILHMGGVVGNKPVEI